MQIDTGNAAELYRLGVITGFALHAAPMSEGQWMVSLKLKEGTDEMLYTQRGHVRIFKSLQGAVSTLESIRGHIRELRVYA